MMKAIYFDRVRAIINEFDPCNLISSGAPFDEYEDLTSKIVNYYLENKSGNEIKSMLLDRLENHFGCIDLDSLTPENRSKFINDLELTLKKIEKELGQIRHA